MSSLKIIAKTKDLRTNTNVLYAEILAKDYIDLVGKDFDKFEIQRKRVEPKKYSRLKSDFKNGALLPGITLAVEFTQVDKYLELIEKDEFDEITSMLNNKEEIYILDGLQRTYIINDINEEKEPINENQKLLLELWFEKEINHLIYRLIVLNSGQKPMSMRHQVELLFMTLKNSLTKDIDGLELYLEKDGQIRSKARKFAFDRIVNAYYSFLTKSPETDRDNLVVKKLNEDDILSSTETELNENYVSFKKYLIKYCELDTELFRVYGGINELSSYKNWLSEENTMKAFFAAVSKFKIDDKRESRMDNALDKLIKTFKDENTSRDIINFEQFNSIKSGIDSKKSNVGVALRKTIMDGFREFFMNEGDESFIECLKIAAQ
ncbi:hypothetical protein [Flavobacterium macrobrachii]|uniref:DUF262 domain-containing protein n=1 Tax=Flavobacterium macrobrachii TaxID=591204 RepID=A0ABS2CWC5_9FLAO|nr:hypothetical protein [Flavobacterium macrobrachii]MBM6499263.1 hypothetical protein [Flavobacterium macrobrachii]